MFGGMCLVALSLFAQAETESAAELPEKVRRLVRQLDANELAKRDEAEAKLIALGPDVLVELPLLSKRSRLSAEIEQRLKRIRYTLEKVAAASATHATLVTLNGEMKLSEIFAALEVQTGNRIVDFRDRFGQQQSESVVLVDFERIPFWDAFDQILDQAGLATYAYGGEKNSLAIVARDEKQLPAHGRSSYAGVFRFEATQIRANRELRNPNLDTLRLGMEIMWEPRLNPISLEQPLDGVTAIDGDGNELLVDRQQGTLESPVQNTISAVEMVIPLALPDRDVRTISSLKGNLTALVPGRVARFTFDDFEGVRNVEQRQAGVTVVLQRYRKDADLHEIRLLVQFNKSSGALASHRGWIYTNESYLIDPEGNRVNHAGFETTRQGVDEAGFSYKFVVENDLKGYRFIYETPAAIIPLRVAYELKDIPLP